MTLATALPHFGEACLGLALTTALLAFGLSIAAYSRRGSDLALLKSAERSLYLSTATFTLAALVLIFCFLTDNFLVRYVFSYSSSAMPIVYKIAALWGGQEGSLLFWVWISSLYGALAIYFHRHTDRSLIPIAITVFSSILIFFGFLLIYHENPFALFPDVPHDGRGLNPLLQNPSMALHPPSLYLGFTGMSVPFAFAISALVSRQLDSRWIIASRRWTLTAWLFLSIGNLLGAQWAYVELGWGGFWGWDPVENAAILPWFTATAFLHSVMIQEKRGMLKFWNVHLIVISFMLTILGTYLTRSGVVQSVHSFARSNIGYFFLGFLAITLIVSTYLIYSRRKDLRSANIFESFFSKESAFVVNNIALVGAAFIILWCTLFPTASELIVGSRVIVGPPFFNKMLAPLGIILLILTGIGPIIAWRRSSASQFDRNFLWPIIVGIIAMGTSALLGITHWYAVLTAFGAAFVLTTVIEEFYRGTLSRITQFGEPWNIALFRASFRNNRKYGGYVVHVGIVLIFIGIAGSLYKDVYEFEMAPGQTVTFDQYSATLEKFEDRESANQSERYAVLHLESDDQFLSEVRPARFFYKNPEQPTTEVDIYSRWSEDVYFTLGDFHSETGSAKIQITLNPLISLLWLGGLILIAGGFISMLPPMEFQRKNPPTKREAA